ncbi:MAG: glycosyltransferase [candidate division Zixibacteria bacterium]|nr:glycosyltransferase [candidate division Zixibacteria bacterium]
MQPNDRIQTVIIVHLPGDFHLTHRREMLLALARELPGSVALLLVNRPITFDVTPLKYPRKFWTGIWHTRVEPEPDRRIWIMTPRLAFHERIAQRSETLVGIKRRLMAAQLKTTLSKYFPRATRIIQWIYHPVQDWVFGTMEGAGKVYECYDEYRWRPTGEFDENTWTREQKTLKSADLTFVTTEGLGIPRTAFARRLECLPNGVPEYFFSPAAQSADPIDSISQPRIGYLGNARTGVAFDLLEAVFRNRPQWNLVFIGPVENESAIQDLKRLINVHFLGRRPQSQVPGLLQRLDVGLVPLLDTGFTRVMAPLKLAEYLASGVPVVATDLPDMRKFTGVVTLVPSQPAPYDSAISECLAQGKPSVSAGLIEAARPYSWNVICRQGVIPTLTEVFHFA